MTHIPCGVDKLALLKNFSESLIVFPILADSIETLAVRVNDSKPSMLFIIFDLAFAKCEFPMGA
jgi:hypothetical protein